MKRCIPMMMLSLLAVFAAAARGAPIVGSGTLLLDLASFASRLSTGLQAILRLARGQSLDPWIVNVMPRLSRLTRGEEQPMIAV